MEAPQGPICQSCGMPLAKDERGGGSEADGSNHQMYNWSAATNPYACSAGRPMMARRTRLTERLSSERGRAGAAVDSAWSGELRRPGPWHCGAARCAIHTGFKQRLCP